MICFESKVSEGLFIATCKSSVCSTERTSADNNVCIRQEPLAELVCVNVKIMLMVSILSQVPIITWAWMQTHKGLLILLNCY